MEEGGCKGGVGRDGGSKRSWRGSEECIQWMPFLPQASKRQITPMFSSKFEFVLNFVQSKVSAQTRLLLTILSNIDMTSSHFLSTLNVCSPWTQGPRDRTKEISKGKHPINSNYYYYRAEAMAAGKKSYKYC